MKIGERNLITDVEGISVGNAEDASSRQYQQIIVILAAVASVRL